MTQGTGKCFDIYRSRMKLSVSQAPERKSASAALLFERLIEA